MGNTLREIKRFLEINAFPMQRRSKPDWRRGVFPFVTISRQVGAGGKMLARALVSELDRQPCSLYHDWKVLDRELCEKLAAEPKLHPSLRGLWSEEYHSELEALVLTLLGGASSQPAAVKKLFEVIRSIATLGKVIILGRAGSCVTASLPQGVHLRLVASEASRIRRMKLASLGEAEAGKTLRKQDRARQQLVRTYFHRDISDPLLYDAVWNTDLLPVEVIASAVIPLIQHKRKCGGLGDCSFSAAG